MAATLSVTELAPVLKELYQDGLDEDLIYKNHPLLGMLKHERDFGGRYKRVAIRYGKPAGTAHTFATAQSNAFTSVYSAFNVTRVNDYGVAKIDGESVDLAKTGDESVMIDDLQAEIDGTLASLGDRAAKEAYRGTSGSRGRVGSGTSSPITLSNPEDIYFFEVGDVLTANDTDDTTTPRSGTGTITNIDEDAGIITYTGTITSLAVGDYLFKQGDEGLAAAGLDAWCPATAPTATAFFGVDRSVSTRLGGMRFNGTTFGFEEVFIRAKARLGRSNSKPDYYFINPTDMANFQAAVSGQKVGVESREYNMGFETVKAYGVTLIEDPDCQRGVAWGIPMDCFWWATLGDAPRIVNEDNLEILRAAAADAYELRCTWRGNFISDAPGLIQRVALPT
jgi:hypothetical protein